MANRDNFRNRAAACEAHDDIPRSPEHGEMIGDVILSKASRLSSVVVITKIGGGKIA
jgi:hypothetical protein